MRYAFGEWSFDIDFVPERMSKRNYQKYRTLVAYSMMSTNSMEVSNREKSWINLPRAKHNIH